VPFYLFKMGAFANKANNYSGFAIIRVQTLPRFGVCSVDCHHNPKQAITN